MRKRNAKLSLTKKRRPVRKDDIFVLTFDILLLCIAVLPLFYIKRVLFPINDNDDKKYHSLAVKIPFAILSGLSIVVSIMILTIIYTFILNLLTDNDPGGFSGASFMIMIPSAIMFYLMLPLFIVFKMNVK